MQERFHGLLDFVVRLRELQLPVASRGLIVVAVMTGKSQSCGSLGQYSVIQTWVNLRRFRPANNLPFLQRSQRFHEFLKANEHLCLRA